MGPSDCGNSRGSKEKDMVTMFMRPEPYMALCKTAVSDTLTVWPSVPQISVPQDIVSGYSFKLYL